MAQAQRNGTAYGRGRSQSQQQQQQDANRPFKELRSSGLKAVIWRNDTSNGQMFNTQLVRVYRDDKDEWHETTSLGRDDLLLAAKLLDQAHTLIMRAEEDERQRQRDQQKAA